ncbi:MAG: carboxypeptidase-like regulatory domain-containing protein, partial [Bacteroidota bacterium]
MVLVLLGHALHAGGLKEISGQVVDKEGKPIPFAKVKTLNPARICMADAEGKFRVFTAEDSAMVVVEKDGFLRKREKVAAPTADLLIEMKVWTAEDAMWEKKNWKEVDLKGKPAKGVVADSMVATGGALAKEYEAMEAEFDDGFSDGDVWGADDPEPTEAPESVEITEVVEETVAGEEAADAEDAWDDAGDDFVDDDWGGEGEEPEEETEKARSIPQAGPGMLTAGEVHDFSSWNFWTSVASDSFHMFGDEWEMRATHRFTVQLQTASGTPVADAKVSLAHVDGRIFWTTRSDNTGKAELWIKAFDSVKVEPTRMSIKVQHKLQRYALWAPKPFHEGINHIEVTAPCEAPAAVDVAFVVDATGSMGDEINFLKSDLQDIMQKAATTLPDLDLRLGSVFYRDQTDDYLSMYFDFTSDAAQATDFVKEQGASGGGDFPEAV